MNRLKRLYIEYDVNWWLLVWTAVVVVGAVLLGAPYWVAFLAGIWVLYQG